MKSFSLSPERVIITFLLSIIVSSAFCQQSKFWGELRKGEFSTGYQDTILFKENEPYSYESYKGKKPFFINMWFPRIQGQEGKYMKYGEYFQFDMHPDLDQVRDSLIAFQRNVLYRSGIAYNLNTWEQVQPSSVTSELNNLVLNTLTSSEKTSQFPKRSFPTIIYHHGAGSSNEENATMFEYLASHGYIIISCNYMLPTSDGYDEYFQDKQFDRATDVEFVTSFAKSLSFCDKNKFYYLGHSRGGGVGFLLNQKGEQPFLRYIILDSTFEGEPLEGVKMMNPLLDSIFRHHPERFKTPMSVISAPTDYYENGVKYVRISDPEFQIFKFLDQSNLTLITYKEPMHHYSFVSLATLRSIYAESNHQIDGEKVTQQFGRYMDIVKMVEDILEGREIDLTKFKIR